MPRASQQTPPLPSLKEINKELAERSLGEYIRQAWPTIEPTTDLIWNWHIDCIAEHLEAVTSGEITRLVINVPPRHMKSISVSVSWPTWSWIHKPGSRWIFTGHKEDLTTKHNLDRRLILGGNWFQENWGSRFKMSTSQDNKTKFQNDKQGFMLSTSIGASVVGEGGDFIVIDDPLDPERAHSDDIRKRAIEYCKYLITRLNNKKTGAIVMIMQRVHEKDPAQALLDLGDYVHLNLPCEAESKTIISFPKSGKTITRDKGDLLWPEREGRKEIDALKRTLGSYKFSAQYQQKPSPAEGGILKRTWWKFYKQLPALEFRIQSWDCSFKGVEQSKNDDPDYVAGQVWGRAGADLYLIDRFRDQASFTETCQAMLTMKGKHSGCIATLVEDKANGPAIIDTLGKAIPGLLAVNPEGGKIARAFAVQPTIEAGNVYLPDPSIAPWVHDFIEECASFPKGGTDDEVDAATQAINYLNNHFAGTEIYSGGVNPSTDKLKGY